MEHARGIHGMASCIGKINTYNAGIVATASQRNYICVQKKMPSITSLQALKYRTALHKHGVYPQMKSPGDSNTSTTRHFLCCVQGPMGHFDYSNRVL